MDKHSLQKKLTEQLKNVQLELERDREQMNDTDIMFDEGYINALMYVIDELNTEKLLEVHCTEDEQEVNFKFTVVGTFIGDQDELVNQERVLDVWRQTDKYTAWEELANADFEIVEELQQ